MWKICLRVFFLARVSCVIGEINRYEQERKDDLVFLLLSYVEG